MNIIISNFKNRLWLGTIASAVTPYALLFFWISKYQGYAYIVSMLAVALAHFLNAKSVYSLTNHPGRKSALIIMPNSILWFTLVWIGLRVAGLPYSVWYLVLGSIISLVCCYLGFRLRVNTHDQTVLAYLPYGRGTVAATLPDVQWIKLEQPETPKQTIQGYVADLRADDLNAQWQKFLAEETLKGIPVYHIRHMEEMLTGRVRIQHMYENDLGSLLPSQNYMRIKYIIDCILIILSLPITLPIMLITAVAIRLESDGHALFIQNRVGLGGKEFKIYKFRSMTKDSETNGAQMASVNDMRVTQIGKFIRKTRIDELPQFWNVLKGDMSLIGPRPEQKSFVNEFDDKIPFYNYRHIVKPGISGWAQVVHGYAANAEETQVKIEYDFYYIKHYSFALDVLIFFKTIKTMLTGFGAR